MTDKQIELIALDCARRMIAHCDATKHYGHYTGYTNGEEALRGVATGKFVFADLCDDNIFIHDVLSEKGLISKNVTEAMNSSAAMGIWNSVVDKLNLAAHELLKERRKATR